MRTFIVSLLLVTIAGCGPKLPPNVSVEAKVAIRGEQLVQALRAAIPEVKKHTCQPTVPQPCLSPNDAVKVFGALETAGRTGEELAKVLTAVDVAKTAAARDEGMAKARTLLTSISTSLQTAVIAPSADEARLQLVALLNNATQLMFAISVF